MNHALRVFVVDPDVFHVELVGQYLTNWGCSQVDLFSDFDLAMQAWDLAPQVVVLRSHYAQEITMEMVQRIKQRNPEVYVVCMIEPAQVGWSPLLHQVGVFDHVLLGVGQAISFHRVFDKLMDVRRLLVRYYDAIDSLKDRTTIDKEVL